MPPSRSITLLSPDELRVELVALRSDAYPMTPLLDAEVAVEAAVTAPSADWN